MCEVVTGVALTWQAIAGYAAIAAAGYSMYSTYQDSQVAQDTANFQAEQAKEDSKRAGYNQDLANQQAADAAERGRVDQQNQKIRVSALRGEQETKLAANGLALNEGSPLSLLEDTEFMGAYDRETIGNNAAREEWGYKTQANNYESQKGSLLSTSSAYKKKAASINPGLNALGAGVSSVSSSWGSIGSMFGGSTKMNASQQNTMDQGMALYGP